MSQYDRLIIAEKPSLARAIAQVYPSIQKKKGCIECGRDIVVWCYGHLLEQAMPEKYGYSKWSLEALPIVPKTWIVEPRKDTQVKAQFNLIKQLIPKVKKIINAGDPDREGQFLVDEILDYFGVNKPVERIWLSETDERSVKKAFAAIKDNQEFAPMKAAALSRSKADWLVGMNLSRAATLTMQKQTGKSGVLPVGRVQTPTLGIVVKRDREVENFVSKNFYVPYVQVSHANGKFPASWIPEDDAKGMDEHGRLLDKKIADELCSQVHGKFGKILSVEEKTRYQAPVLPHYLTSLQSEVYKKYGLEPKEVLSITQKLYEDGLVSYPRTDCRYLSEEQLEDAPRILSALKKFNLGADKADSSIKSAAWDKSKVGAHHGIIPTGKLRQFEDREFKIFEIIARGYVRQFYPKHKYLEQKIVVKFGQSRWQANGKITQEPGWIAVDGIKALSSGIPQGMVQGDIVKCLNTKVESKKTTPPTRYTKIGLQEQMEKVHLLVEDEKYRKKLKENSGLGTEATRTMIVEELIKRGFLKMQGKKIISTEIGRILIDSIPATLSDPGLTALWEDALKMIEEQKMSESEFMQKQEKFILSQLNKMIASDFSSFKGVQMKQNGGREAFKKKKGGTGRVCPECGEKTLLRRKNKKGEFYWGCFNKEKHKEDRPVFLPDDNGKPVKKGKGAKK